MKNTGIILALALWWISSAQAQINTWQLGGAGLAWSDQDTVSVMVDFNGEGIHPIYLTTPNGTTPNG